MSGVSWPSSVAYDNGFCNECGSIMKAVRDGEAEYIQDLGLSVYGRGKGRVVYDISAYTDIPAVLRVAHEPTGVDETRLEIERREEFNATLRERFVPVVDYGPEYRWSVQPKCDEIPLGQKTEAMEELTQLVEATGRDGREVHIRNVGLWDDVPVLFDYGGL